MQANQFLDQLAAEKVSATQTETTLAKLTKDPEKFVKPLVDFVAEQINTGHLAQARLSVSNAEIEIRLETSIINLPLRYGKAIQKVVKEDADYPLNVYMVIESPDVNRSSLRIDEVASDQGVALKADQYVSKVAEWVSEQLTQIKENQAAAKEASAKAKKATTKKTTTKKTTKKQTTKKSAKK